MVFLDFWLIKLWNSRKVPCRKPTHPRNCLGKYHGITVKLSVSSITVFGIWLEDGQKGTPVSRLIWSDLNGLNERQGRTITQRGDFSIREVDVERHERVTGVDETRTASWDGEVHRLDRIGGCDRRLILWQHVDFGIFDG